MTFSLIMRLIWKVVCLICSGVMEQEYRRFASSILYLRKFWEGRGAEGTAEGLEAPRYVRLRVRWFFCQRRGGCMYCFPGPEKHRRIHSRARSEQDQDGSKQDLPGVKLLVETRLKRMLFAEAGKEFDRGLRLQRSACSRCPSAPWRCWC